MHTPHLAPITYHNTKRTTAEYFVPSQKLDFVLIGMYVDTIPIPSGGRIHQYNALIVMQSCGKYLFKKVRTQEALEQWISHLEPLTPIIRYTDKDLRIAFLAHPYTDVDFSIIPTVHNDRIFSLVGVERYTSELDIWNTEDMQEEFAQSYKNRTIPRTRRVEKVTILVLFLYNLLFAYLVFPTTPVMPSGIIQLTDTILIGYILANLLIPIVLVLWRNFCSWHLPLLFTLVVLASTIIGGSIALSIVYFPLPFISILLLNGLNYLLWTLAMMGMKLYKMTVLFIRHWDFG